MGVTGNIHRYWQELSEMEDVAPAAPLPYVVDPATVSQSWGSVLMDVEKLRYFVEIIVLFPVLN